MKCFKIKIPVKPVGKARPRVSNNHAYTPYQTRLAEESIQIYLRAKQAPILDGPVGISLQFAITKPKTALKKRKYPDVKPDIDNCVKLVLDACNGILYNDDSQIVDLHAYKRYENQNSITIEIMEKENNG